jgi:phosphohistidine swiveling domain-containing protein
MKEDREKLIDKIKKTEWHSDWSGPFSLFGLSLPTNVYFDGLEKHFGKGLSQIFVVFKNGVAFSRLPEDEYRELGEHLTEKAQDESFLKKWTTQFKELADIVVRETPLATEAFINKFADLLPHLQAYGAHNAATKIVFDVGYDKLSREAKELLEDARKYSETFYKEDAERLEKAIGFIAEESGYPHKEIYMLTYDELGHYQDSQDLPSHEALQARWGTLGVYFTRAGSVFLSADEVALIEEDRAGQSVQEIAGRTAYKGKVIGKCRVVLDYKNADIEEGDILVTGMTDPQFISLMKKAGAIVTDGGGMLSHAAIVARELKKPCVIGTKIATQVLRDGDMVEVDANNGIVRIING